MKATLPSLETLASLSGDSSEVSKHLQHNVQLWSWINGAFGMLKDEALAFDTQQDYWYRTDRRIVAAYLHRRLRESYYSAADLRALAQHLPSPLPAAGLLGPVRSGRQRRGPGSMAIPRDRAHTRSLRLCAGTFPDNRRQRGRARIERSIPSPDQLVRPDSPG